LGRGNFNLYFAFFELGLEILNEQGSLGYITPNNYFTSLAAKDLRKFFQESKVLRKIVDFNHLRIFKDATTYTGITFLSKSEEQSFKFLRINNLEDINKIDKLNFSKINLYDLNPKKWRLMDKKDLFNIKQIEETGVPLGKFAKIRVGIATLKDTLYFLDGKNTKGNFYIKEHSGKKYLIEKEITRKIIKISSVNSDKELIEDKRQIIFPYKLVDKTYKGISEKELSEKFPECYSYLLDIKSTLSERDKGEKPINPWYVYGRGQGLNFQGRKLLTKTFSNKPNFMTDKNGMALFCNGYAIFPEKEEDLVILKKILNSKIMDYYAKKTSVGIGGDYQCYQKNFIETFSIPLLEDNEKKRLLEEKDPKKIFSLLFEIYGLRECNGLTL